MENRIRNWFAFIMMLLIAFILFSCREPIKNTKGIPGNKNEFDPIAALPKVTAFAGKGAVLTYLSASFIKPDGTMDIEAEYKPIVQYGFWKKLAPAKGKNKHSDVPLGASRPKSEDALEWETIGVLIIKPYTKDIVKPGFDGIWLMRSGGMEKNAKSWGSSSNFEEDYPVYQAASLPLPFSTIWQKAIDLGAPADNAVASIMYNPKWGYTFEISNTSYKYTFDLKGNQIE